MDVVQAEWLQWLLFSILAVLSLLLLRRPLIQLTHGHPPQDMDSMVGESAILLEELQPGHTGKAELRGSTWSARNVGAAPLPSGHRATVTKVDGLVLWVKSE
jgi:membrane protein implicated in regulation of membrane protease activity